MTPGALEESGAVRPPEGGGPGASRLGLRLALATGLGASGLGLLAVVGQILLQLSPGAGWRLASIPSGLALFCVGLAFTVQTWSRRRTLHPITALLALFTMGSELAWLYYESGIREAWTPEQWGRTALDVGVSMLLISLSLLLGRPPGWRTRLGQLLSGLVLFAGLLALTGHAFGAAPIYRLGELGPVPTSLGGALGLVLLGIAGLALPPLSGPLAVLLSPRLGGIAARRMMLFLLAVPLIARTVALGVSAGLYQADTALALASLLSAAACALLVIRLGAQLNGVDEELEATREALGRRGDWLASVIDQLPEAVLILDAEGRISLFNGTARLMIPGLRMGEWLGNAPPELLTGLSDGLSDALVKGRATVGREVKLKDRDGNARDLLASIAPLRTGTRNGEAPPGGVVIVLQDVGVMKELERLREEWTAVVAHDLRQPVAVISLAAQQLLRNPDMEASRRAVLGARILEVSNGLARMVSDLLDASRIESRRMEVTPVPVELGHELASVLRFLEDLTPGNRVRFEPASEPCPVRVDVQRLRQVVGNLLTNAAKYGDPGAPIVVTVRREETEVVVGVHNRGRTVPPEQLSQLFQRYARVPHPQTMKRPGVGLGLYITRGLVEAHGGRVWAESEAGLVSVYFTLPLGEAAPGPERGASSAPVAPDPSQGSSPEPP